MPKSERTRIDYMPSQAALEALSLAAERFPELRPQALLDKLVITAASALRYKHWHAPYLCGTNRDKWKLPDDLRRESVD